MQQAEGFLESRFPADFIAEGLDQTRGWFYTLMVLSTALFDKPAFKNLIVNGLVSEGQEEEEEEGELLFLSRVEEAVPLNVYVFL